MMSTIEVLKDTFSFDKDLEHLFLFVDGERLDQLISRLLADKAYLDLLPSWLDYYSHIKDSQRAKEYVWRNSSLDDGLKHLPVLICPDELDFSCTTIVAEVIPEGDRVIWNRFGQDTTGHPNYIGESVHWFPNIGPFVFDKADYLSCLEALKNFEPLPAKAGFKCGQGSKGFLAKLKKSFTALMVQRVWRHPEEPANSIRAPQEAPRAPSPWKLIRFLHVGGLSDMGFDPTERYVLIASSSGLGLFDLTDGARVARNSHFERGYADPDSGTVEGIGLLDGRQVTMFGLFGHPVSRKLLNEAAPLEHGVTELKSVLRTSDGQTLILGHSDGAYVFQRQNN